MENEMRFSALTPEETEKVGAKLAQLLLEEAGDEYLFVALHGDLGAGKTVLVRGFASVLSPGSRVKSPTYTLVNEYRKGPVPLFHFDLYRAENADDFDSLGMNDYLNGGHCIVEWSEYMRDFPENTVHIYVKPQPDGSREILCRREEIQ